MNQNNILKCSECGLDMINEEIISHKCSKPSMDFWVLDDKFLIWDGYRYIPINRKFTGQQNNRGFDRTLKQHSYKVQVPYHTVW